MCVIMQQFEMAVMLSMFNPIPDYFNDITTSLYKNASGVAGHISLKWSNICIFLSVCMPALNIRLGFVYNQKFILPKKKNL